MKKKNFKKGMVLTEVLVAVVIFAMLGAAIYSATSFILKVETGAKARVLASNVASSELEIVRNIPYDDVGVVDGSPSGSLPQNKIMAVGGINFNVSFDVRYVDDGFDGFVDGTPPDTNPADYKLVQAVITCAQCPNFNPVKMTTTVSPNGIEGGGDYGFLFVKIINAAGQPIPQAAVHIESTNLAPQRIIDSVTDNNGNLKILDLVPSIQGYHIGAAKTGYSIDSTVTPTVDNPNPSKPDATIALGTVTQVTLSIDLVSTLNIITIRDTCVPIGSIAFTIRGDKLLSSAPLIYKYSQNFTMSPAGAYVFDNLEWDNYTIGIVSDQGYDIAGFILLSPVKIDPGSSHNLKIILTAHDRNSLLVTVKDISTMLPLTNIDLKLYEGLSGWEYLPHPVTGQGYFIQTDWSGSSGQKDFSVDAFGYYSTDGNLSLTSPSGEIRLKKVGPNYLSPGELISSTFDTGMSSNFIMITWDPLIQPPQTGQGSVKFQVATSNENNIDTVWNFTGPDGTGATYYDSSNTNISVVNNSHRYIRYKIILSTEDSSRTPGVGSAAISFNSGCTPPGQAIFTGLSNGNYSLDATDQGGVYQPYTGTVNITGATWWEILLNP